MSGLLIGTGVGLSHPQPAAGGGGGPHAVNAVRFNRGDTYLNRGAALTGAVNGDAFLCSFWFNVKGGDGLFSSVFTSIGQNWIIRKQDTNVWFCLAKNAADTILFSLLDTTVFTTSVNTGWHHMLLAGDLSAGSPTVQMYIDDVSEASVTPTVDDMDFDDTEWEVARDVNAAGNGFDGEIAELWWTTSFLDLDTESNRHKFIDADNFPVDLGATGQLPLGSDPICFFSGATAAWQTNKGTGGGFTENGTLVIATSFPSD